MTENYYEMEYENKPKENYFEFIIENIAAFGFEYGILNNVDLINDIIEKRDLTVFTQILYYSLKDLVLPKIIEKFVYFLKDSNLGRWILKYIMKIEKNKGITIIFNSVIIAMIQKTLGYKIDFVQLVYLQVFEFGVDKTSDYVFDEDDERSRFSSSGTKRGSTKKVIIKDFRKPY